eukprot:Nitzschia sp. Nitz4//scaffold7_size249615//12741//14165//NITZ4_001135-RA/size249615-processed-gene-0.169-mRNA-1//-1//CDS//3329558316//8826//frame0
MNDVNENSNGTSPAEPIRNIDIDVKERPKHEKELHIAPMLNVSKREFRKLFSILSTKVLLWTDMVVDTTIAHSDKLEDVLEGDMDVPNVQVCQIGGNSPELCGASAKIVSEDFGYTEVNLNVDCPSDRVSLERQFGAVLMKYPDISFSVLEAMKKSCNVPVSIKCRIGVDEDGFDSFDYLVDFIRQMRPVCQRFYLHARLCCLNGLYTARQNRSIPPLNYPRVYEICNLFPDCEFWINGGIRTLDHAKDICFGTASPLDPKHQVPCDLCAHSNGSCVSPPCPVPSNLRGCMLGRAAMENPAIFADADRYFYGLPSNPCKNRRQVLDAYCTYLEDLYPRRCCDDQDDVVTYKLPVPDIRAPKGVYCPVCRPMYLPDSPIGEEEVRVASKSSTTPKRKPKIAPRLIGRALIPIRGMFFGQPKSKQFNKRLDDLGRDLAVRNCGPGYMIRKALEVFPDWVLDQEITPSEDYANQKFH